MSSGKQGLPKPGGSAGYSAKVRMELRVNGRRLRVSKVGPNRLYLTTPEAMPESRGELVIRIDGREHRQGVVLRPSAVPTREFPAEFEPES